MKQPENRLLLENLLDQMEGLLDGQLWYGTTILTKLEQISPKESITPPLEGVHCIQQILLHMDTWRGLFLSRLEGNQEVEIMVDSADDWVPLEQCEASKWQTVVKKFQANYQRMLEVLRSLDDDRLDQQAGNAEYSLRFMAEGILHHDIYHLGQIAIVHKMLKTR